MRGRDGWMDGGRFGKRGRAQRDSGEARDGVERVEESRREKEGNGKLRKEQSER